MASTIWRCPSKAAFTTAEGFPTSSPRGAAATMNASSFGMTSELYAARPPPAAAVGAVMLHPVTARLVCGAAPTVAACAAGGAAAAATGGGGGRLPAGLPDSRPCAGSRRLDIRITNTHAWSSTLRAATVQASCHSPCMLHVSNLPRVRHTISAAPYHAESFAQFGCTTEFAQVHLSPC